MNGYKTCKIIVLGIVLGNLYLAFTQSMTLANYLLIIMGVQIYAYLDLKSDIKKGTGS